MPKSFLTQLFSWIVIALTVVSLNVGWGQLTANFTVGVKPCNQIVSEGGTAPGTLILSVSGGSGNYSYLLDNGDPAWSPSPALPNGSASFTHTIENAVAGTYLLEITDLDDPNGYAFFELQVYGGEVISAAALPTVNQILCYGGTGSILLNINSH